MANAYTSQIYDQNTYPFLIMSLSEVPNSAWKWQWNTQGTGAKHKGSFWYITPPMGYVTLGSVFLPRVDATHVEKDISKHTSRPGQIAFCLKSFAKQATSANESWDSKGSGGRTSCTFWVPTQMPGYGAIGTYVWKEKPVQPTSEDMRQMYLVSEDVLIKFTTGANDASNKNKFVWSDSGTGSSKSVNVKVAGTGYFMDYKKSG